jgi:FixJ family two-component response regulator
MNDPASLDQFDDRAIFIVDDDEAVRDSLRILLETQGFRAAAFASAEVVLAALEMSRPACLVVDVNMPEVSGLELIDTLIARAIRIPTVFITGRIDAATRRAFAARPEIVLKKPFTDTELITAIRHARAPRDPGPPDPSHRN